MFTNYRLPTQDIKFLDIRYKFIHQIVYTKSELQKIKIIDTNACTFCENELENRKHLFVSCVYVKKYLVKDIVPVEYFTARKNNFIAKLGGNGQCNH